MASTTAQSASGHVDKLNTTVNGLDQYKPVSEVVVPFRGGNPVLSQEAKDELDAVVAKVNGRQGYIVEIEAHNPARGSAGIENSRRLANVVDRYLVEHDIPVYRVHTVALGNAPMASSEIAMAGSGSTTADSGNAMAGSGSTGSGDEMKPVRKSSVSVRLMENSLAAPDTASPQGAVSENGAARP
jgi:hypothetical protein